MRFLVVRFSSLGDIITTTAFLVALRERYPEAEIYYATKHQFAELLEDQPYLNGVFGLKDNESLPVYAKRINLGFDCVFDLHKNPRSMLLGYLLQPKQIKRVKKHTLYRLSLVYPILKPVARKRKTRYNIDDQLDLIGADYSFKPRLFVEKANLGLKRPIVGIAAGAKWETKRWRIDGFEELIGMLHENCGASIVLFGSKDEESIGKRLSKACESVLNLTGKLSIRQTASCMADCDIVVSNDSALMHMAVALDKPVVAIFGPTVEGFGFFPKSEKSLVIENRELTCRPCSLHGTNRCPRNDHACMKEIDALSVFEGVKKLIGE